MFLLHFSTKQFQLVSGCNVVVLSCSLELTKPKEIRMKTTIRKWLKERFRVTHSNLLLIKGH